MATVTATFACTLALAAGYSMSGTGDVRLGEDRVFRTRFPDGDRMSDAEYFDLVDRIFSESSDPTALVFAYAEAIHMDELGALGLAIKTAPTLRDSLIRIERYFCLATDTVRYRLVEGNGIAVFLIESNTALHPAIPLRNECALAGFASNMLRFGGEGLVFERVTFGHSCKTEPARYAAHFGCPVDFDTKQDAITLRQEMLDMPNRLGDAAVSNFLTAHLDAQLDALPRSLTFSERLIRHFSTRLSEGIPRAAQTAMALGVSERTMYRRLADEGQTYQGVLRQAQQALAEDLLANNDCAISEVAFLTGFSEQSTFSRAFKRWVGQSPARYRLHSASA